MLRAVSLFALVSGLLNMAAYRADLPEFAESPCPINSTISAILNDQAYYYPVLTEYQERTDADTTAGGLRVLMLNYSSYDSEYAGKISRMIRRQVPGAAVSDFWEGPAEELWEVLSDQQAVVVAYPSGGSPAILRAYGKVLNRFVRQGGVVVFTGTHEYSVLQQYGLFDLDFGYYCSEPDIHETWLDHPVLAGTPEQFTLNDYAYPLDISDPNFVSLADVRGYPVMGYKSCGAGKIIYLGFEYYFDEPITSRMMINALRMNIPARPAPSADWGARTVKRTEELLFAGSGTSRSEKIDLKIYPNPYMSKGTLDVELTKPSTVSIEMTNESGQIVAVLLPSRNLNSGLYRFELPNVDPGVYFVQCQVGGQKSARKVVKAEPQ